MQKRAKIRWEKFFEPITANLDQRPIGETEAIFETIVEVLLVGWCMRSTKARGSPMVAHAITWKRFR